MSRAKLISEVVVEGEEIEVGSKAKSEESCPTVLAHQKRTPMQNRALLLLSDVLRNHLLLQRAARMVHLRRMQGLTILRN